MFTNYQKIILIILLVFINFSFAQKNLIPSRVFPSARWVWYILSTIDSDWKDSQGNIIMTKDEIDRWTAAHTDWLIAGFPFDNQLQANPNLRGTDYNEFFNIKTPNWTSDASMIKTYNGRWVDGKLPALENYFFSHNLDPESIFFHLGEDHQFEFDGNGWDYLGKLGEVYTSDPWKFNPEYNPRSAFWGVSDCNINSSYPYLPTATNSFVVFGRPMPFEQIYLEWTTPPQEGQYILEYVSKTTILDDGREIPVEWKPLEIIYDETNGLKNDGLIKFKQPKAYSEWKRAFLVNDRPRKDFMIRLRIVNSPQNKPKMKCFWVNEVFRFYPLLKENNNELYLGYKQPFSSVKLYFYYPSSTPLNPLSFTIEYPNVATSHWMGIIPTNWQKITNFTDNTNGFLKDGTLTIQIPQDWQLTKIAYQDKISSMSPLRYWLRIALTATPTFPVVLIKAEIPNQRQLYRQEIFSTKYLSKVLGWDSRNDKNNDGYVDDNEFSNLINPKATARYKWHSRVANYGWSASLDYPINFANPEIRDKIKEFFVFFINSTTNPLKQNGVYSDSMIISDPIGYRYKNAKIIEPKENWELYWNEFHGYLKDNLNLLVGGNPAATQPYAPHSWETRFLDTQFYTHKYLDYLNHEGWPHGWGTTYLRSFVDRLLNFAQETGNKMYQVLQFNMQWNNLLNVGGSKDATGWYRFLEHSLAYFYLIQHPDLSFLSIWTGVWYSNKIDTFPIGTMPRTMAYQPTKMLKVDIGKPANTIPQGYKPLILKYYSEHPQYRGNFILGDTTMSYLNNPNFPLMHNKPIYPTYIFILATGTLPKATTYNQYAIFARQYTKGLVLLKMTDNSGQYYTDDNSLTTHPLPGLYRRVNWDGTLGPVINQISLKGMEGAILVKAEDYPPGSEIITDFKKYLKIALFADNYNPQSGDIITYQAILRNISTTTLIRTKFSFPLFSDQKYIQNSAYLTINNVKYYSISYRPHQLIISIPYLSPKQQITLTWKMRK